MYNFIEVGIKRFMDVLLWITFLGSVIWGFINRGVSIDLFTGEPTFNLGSALFGAVIGGIGGLILNFIYGGIIVTLISLKETAENINQNLYLIAGKNKSNEASITISGERIFEEHTEGRTKKSITPKKTERIGESFMSKKDDGFKIQWPD